MIQGTLLYNDALVIEGVSKKYYSVKPRVVGVPLGTIYNVKLRWFHCIWRILSISFTISDLRPRFVETS